MLPKKMNENSHNFGQNNKTKMIMNKKKRLKTIFAQLIKHQSEVLSDASL